MKDATATDAGPIINQGAPKTKRPLNQDEAVKEIFRAQYCCATFKTILYYLRNQVAKERRAFNTGIFTVFLCVTVITFFQSVVSLTPILFVKFGQKTAGTVDIAIIPEAKNYSIDGNVNWYDVDPFNDPYHTPASVTNVQSPSPE